MIGLLLGMAFAHGFSGGLAVLDGTTLQFQAPNASVTLSTDCGAPPDLACEPTTLRVHGLGGSDQVLVRVGSEVHTLTASAPLLALQRPVPPRWLRQGFTHALSGLDHVLFILGLVALTPRRRLLATVTGFTAGHALSLTAAASGLVTLPGAPLEALIALSVVWLARALLTPDPRDGGLQLAVVFGLLHGLGFAAGLGDLGLDSLPRALLSFHVGIELAQLLVVLIALPLVARLPAAAVGWPLGAVAACWTLQRLAALGT